MDNFSKQIYEAGINDGKAEGKAESIKNLMSTINVSIDQAMDILKTPPEERQYFKDLCFACTQIAQKSNVNLLIPENVLANYSVNFKK